MKCLFITSVIVILGAQNAQAFLWNWFVPRVRVCLRSADETRLPTGCIMCDRSSFPTIMESCTDVPYLPENVTTDQGLCISRSCSQEGVSNQGGFFNFFGGGNNNNNNNNPGFGGGIFGNGFFGRRRRDLLDEVNNFQKIPGSSQNLQNNPTGSQNLQNNPTGPQNPQNNPTGPQNFQTRPQPFLGPMTGLSQNFQGFQSPPGFQDFQNLPGQMNMPIWMQNMMPVVYMRVLPQKNAQKEPEVVQPVVKRSSDEPDIEKSNAQLID